MKISIPSVLFLLAVGTQFSCQSTPQPPEEKPIDTTVLDNRVSKTVRDTLNSNNLESLKVSGLDLSIPSKATGEEKSKLIHAYIQKVNAHKSQLIAERKQLTQLDQERFGVPFKNIFALTNLNDLKYFKVSFDDQDQRISMGYYVHNNKIVAAIRNIDKMGETWEFTHPNVFYFNNGFMVNATEKSTREEAEGLYKSALLTLKIYNS